MPNEWAHERQKASFDSKGCRPYQGQKWIYLLLKLKKFIEVAQHVRQDLRDEKGRRVQIEEVADVVQNTGGSA